MDVSPVEIVLIVIFALFFLICVFQTIPDLYSAAKLRFNASKSNTALSSEPPTTSPSPMNSPNSQPSPQPNSPNQNTQISDHHQQQQQQQTRKNRRNSLRRAMFIFRRQKAPKDTKLKRKARVSALVVAMLSCVIAFSAPKPSLWLSLPAQKTLETVINFCILFIGTYIVFVFLEMYAKVIEMDTEPAQTKLFVWPYNVIRWGLSVAYLVMRISAIYENHCILLIVTDVIDIVCIMCITLPWLVSMVLMCRTLWQHIKQLDLRKYREKEKLNLRIAMKKLVIISVAVIGLFCSSVVDTVLEMNEHIAKLKVPIEKCFSWRWTPSKSVFFLIVLLYYAWKHQLPDRFDCFGLFECYRRAKRRQQNRDQPAVAIVVEAGLPPLSLQTISVHPTITTTTPTNQSIDNVEIASQRSQTVSCSSSDREEEEEGDVIVKDGSGVAADVSQEIDVQPQQPPEVVSD